MKLEAYLNKTRKSIEEFAQETGISAQAIYKYLRGERLPRKEFLNRLAVITGGEVTANDFLDLSLSGLIGLPPGSDHYALLLGVSPKVRLWQ